MQKLWNGNASLGLSYWVYGVGAGLIWGLVFAIAQPAPGSIAAVSLLSCMAIYFGIVYIGIWRAANKYQGTKAWRTLAKFSVIVGFVATVLPVAIGLLASAVP